MWEDDEARPFLLIQFFSSDKEEALEGILLLLSCEFEFLD